MTRQIEQIEINGQAVWVEVVSLPTVVVAGAAKGSESGKFGKTSADTVVAKAIERADVASTLAAVVTPVREALNTYKPDEVSLALTLGFKADVGVFVASGEANAQLKVNLKWKCAGYTARTVGYVMHASDDDVPWQRVINSQGKCSTGKLTIPINLQQELLEAEGVIFNAAGKCDLGIF